MAALALTAAACTGPTATSPNATAAPSETAKGVSGKHNGYRFAVVTHGTAGDMFWNVVKNGAVQAGKDLKDKVSYYSDGDPGAQSKLIDNAVAQHVDGLVVSMANPPALKASIQRAVQAGIPVVTINSGEEQSAAYGAIGHVGQNESVAGEAAGKRFAQAGKHKLLCVIHEAGNVGQNQRCDGAAKGFGGTTKRLQVDISNPTDTRARIQGALQADPSIDAVLTLNSQVAALAVKAKAGANAKAAIATFDLNADVVNEIKGGQLLFAVDQQQYEQGYLPIVMLSLYLNNGNTVGGGKPVLTGPAFVDKSNVNTVGQYVDRGTR
ncbi:sugar ABC transporter substrate-binding protein [Mangrovactinospora gilvigrisea]|uniref:sugar ABC transporter substrate-binding protein n=1 Tax=Mangrovactinospora gilvigrisea TaxID=1428644 RepID=UPI001FEA44D6|nr:sugar ABC transporter substrate-binding protein [Mangrovactinospora gilvigrisea]